MCQIDVLEAGVHERPIELAMHGVDARLQRASSALPARASLWRYIPAITLAYETVTGYDWPSRWLHCLCDVVAILRVQILSSAGERDALVDPCVCLKM